jgi:hypothetical protein
MRTIAAPHERIPTDTSNPIECTAGMLVKSREANPRTVAVAQRMTAEKLGVI